MPPAPSWHPGAHPAARPGRVPGLCPSQGPWHHLPGAGRITAAALCLPCQGHVLPGRHLTSLCKAESELQRQPRPGLCRGHCRALGTLHRPLHKAGATPRAWGARGIGKHLCPGCLQAACSSAPQRAHVCTAAQCLASAGGGMLHALGAGRWRWEDLGSPPAHTHPAPSLGGAEADAGPSLRETNQSGQGAGSLPGAGGEESSEASAPHVGVLRVHVPAMRLP